MEAQTELPLIGSELRARIGAFGSRTSLSQRIEARAVQSSIVIDLDADEIELPSTEPDFG